jgi:hypothetical protein
VKTLWSGEVLGTFFGYKGGRPYTLSDGSIWIQNDHTDEPVYRQDPKARLLRDGAGRT